MWKELQKKRQNGKVSMTKLDWHTKTNFWAWITARTFRKEMPDGKSFCNGINIALIIYRMICASGIRTVGTNWRKMVIRHFIRKSKLPKHAWKRANGFWGTIFSALPFWTISSRNRRKISIKKNLWKSFGILPTGKALFWNVVVWSHTPPIRMH